MSSQLQDGSTCEQQQQQQDHSVTHTAEGKLAEHAAEVISSSILSEASAQHAGAVGAAGAAAGRNADTQQHQQQQGKKKRSKSSKPPLAGLKLLQPRSGSRMVVDCRAGGAAGQAADMSDVFKALQYQVHSQEQQQQLQPEQALGDCAASAGPAAAVALPHATLSEEAAAAAPGPAVAGGFQPVVCGSSSIGPCRTDLSGELAVIKQELSSNGSIDHASCNSSMMHLPMPGPSSSGYDAGSSHSRGMQQHEQQQQEDSAAVQQQRKRQRPSFQYGNYHHYYGYRIGPSGFEDARLKVGLLSVHMGPYVPQDFFCVWLPMKHKAWPGQLCVWQSYITHHTFLLHQLM
jgi:hypothetical protein